MMRTNHTIPVQWLAKEKSIRQEYSRIEMIYPTGLVVGLVKRLDSVLSTVVLLTEVLIVGSLVVCSG